VYECDKIEFPSGLNKPPINPFDSLPNSPTRVYILKLVYINKGVFNKNALPF